jgi:hypothetical protein
LIRRTQYRADQHGQERISAGKTGKIVAPAQCGGTPEFFLEIAA